MNLVWLLHEKGIRVGGCYERNRERNEAKKLAVVDSIQLEGNYEITKRIAGNRKAWIGTV